MTEAVTKLDGSGKQAESWFLVHFRQRHFYPVIRGEVGSKDVSQAEVSSPVQGPYGTAVTECTTYLLTLALSLIQLILYYWCHDSQIQQGKQADHQQTHLQHDGTFPWGGVRYSLNGEGLPRDPHCPVRVLWHWSALGCAQQNMLQFGKRLRTIFWVTETVETSSPHAHESQRLKAFWEMIYYSKGNNINPT